MKEPLISIIMPIYNVEKYLEKGIESIIGQTYSNLEVLLIDDGSRDRCGNICDRFAEKDNRIKVIHRQNGGVSSARNLGIDMSKGEYIYFIDGDDFCEPELIMEALRYMEQTASDLVVFNYRDIYSDGSEKHRFVFESRESVFLSSEDRFDYFFHIFLQYKQGFEVWNRLYKKDIIKKGKVRFSEGINFAEDLYFNFLYLLNVNKVSCMEEVFYNRAQREDSIIKCTTTPQINSFVKLAYWLYNYCSSKKDEQFMLVHFYCLFARMMNNQVYRIKKEHLKKYFREIEYYIFYNGMNKKIMSHPISVMKYFGIKSGTKQCFRALFLYLYFKVYVYDDRADKD